MTNLINNDINETKRISRKIKNAAKRDAKAGLLKGEAAFECVFDATGKEVDGLRAIKEAITLCSRGEGGDQENIRRAYVMRKLIDFFSPLCDFSNPKSVIAAREHAASIYDGTDSNGITKVSQGKHKRAPIEKSKYGTFKTDWSRLLTDMGVLSDSKKGMGQRGKPKTKTETTTDKPAKPKKVTIEASPKVVLIADAFAHMQVISKALITFGVLNRDVKGFDYYTKAINDFNVAVNRLPKE